jgi:hypothetical protein
VIEGHRQKLGGGAMNNATIHSRLPNAKTVTTSLHILLRRTSVPEKFYCAATQILVSAVFSERNDTHSGTFRDENALFRCPFEGFLIPF